MYLARARRLVAGLLSGSLPLAAGFCAPMLLCALSHAGEGIFLPGNDAQQMGRGSSGVASPRSAYWSFMNPAAMVDLERRLDVNWYSVFSDFEAHPRGVIGNRFEGTLESEVTGNLVAAGFVWPLKSGTLGGGFFVPSGSGVDYPHSRTWLTRLVGGNGDRRLSYQHLRGVLACAHDLGGGWSVGLGVHGSLSRLRTDHLTLSFSGAEANHAWENALGAGFGLGLYKKWDRWAWGLNYVSRHWTQTMKAYEDLLRNALDTPQTVQTGVAWKASEQVELTLDYKWLNWAGIPAFGGDLLSQGGFGWRDQHGVKFGVEWKAHRRWTVMAGYSHANSPIHDDHVLVAMMVPVTPDRHWALGISHKINDRHHIHVAGIWTPTHTQTDTGRGGEPFSLLGKGTTLSASALSLAVGYSFLF